MAGGGGDCRIISRARPLKVFVVLSRAANQRQNVGALVHSGAMHLLMSIFHRRMHEAMRDDGRSQCLTTAGRAMQRAGAGV